MSDEKTGTITLKAEHKLHGLLESVAENGMCRDCAVGMITEEMHFIFGLGQSHPNDELVLD